MIHFGIKYCFVFLLAVITAALVVSLFLYFRNKAYDLSKWQIRLLAALRFFSFFMVAFLLLSPFVRNLKKIKQKPLIVAAWDNSESVVVEKNPAEMHKRFVEMQDKLHKALGDKYEIVDYTFGDNVKIGKTLTFSEKRSDYSRLISTVNNNYFNQNVGALVIVGDGIYNQGKNPLNQSGEIPFPVYAVGVGDTSVVADAKIESIRTNRTAFSGNKFQVEADVHFSMVKNRPLKLSVWQGEKEIQRVVITPPGDNYFITKEFILEAGTPGLKHYSAKIQAVENERNTANNTADFVINVLKNKQKILILSDGPHPDVGAIKSTLEKQKTYEVSVFTEEPYPRELRQFNLIVLNQLPTASKSMKSIVEKANKNRLPLLFIVGQKTFISQLNQLSQGVQIKTLSESGEEAQAFVNSNYVTFNLSEDFGAILPKFPPLLVPFADYDLDAGLTPVLYQKLKNIETDKPLIVTGKIDGRKIGFIFGEGIWRWRLSDYYLSQNHKHFTELTGQMVQYLALRENEDNFIVDFSPVYTETDDVILRAELYNDAYEKITSGEVNIELRNAENEVFDFVFDVQGGDYYLNAGHLPVGDYSFTANVTLGDDTFAEQGSFTVVAVNLENIATQANHHMLYQLASLSGGQFFLAEGYNALIASLKDDHKLKTVNYYQEMINELLNMKALFFILLLLLSVEWFLRKYWGIY
mgnify:CR=1 FL=1